MKKLLSILLVVCMAVGLVAPVGAAIIPAGFIPVYTPEDLDNIRKNPASSYILMNDLDMSAWGNWEPLAANEWVWDEFEIDGWCSRFTGVFDGGGHTISNLTSEWQDASLFGWLDESALVKNLNLANVNIEGWTAGAVATLALDNSAIVNVSVTGNITGYRLAGGIVGFINAEDEVDARIYIRGCHNAANVTSYETAGGIVGEAVLWYWPTEKMIMISRSSNSGTISAIAQNNDTIYVGGIQGRGNATIVNSYNTGIVQGGGGWETYIGGITGSAHLEPYGRLINTGEVRIIGSEDKVYIGAIAGHSNGSVVYSYFSNELPAVGSSRIRVQLHSVQQLKSAELRQRSSYRGFDFNSVWQINEGVSSPTLRADNSDALADPVPQIPLWTLLPDWIQFILRNLLFGWLWFNWL